MDYHLLCPYEGRLVDGRYDILFTDQADNSLRIRVLGYPQLASKNKIIVYTGKEPVQHPDPVAICGNYGIDAEFGFEAPEFHSGLKSELFQKGLILLFRSKDPDLTPKVLKELLHKGADSLEAGIREYSNSILAEQIEQEAGSQESPEKQLVKMQWALDTYQALEQRL
jgi:hypothetical protein